jgi:hypothetical protein
MTRTTNARLAGVTLLVYLAAGIGSLVLSNRATSGAGMAAKLASLAQHATEMRVVVVLTVITSFCALILGVTFYAITRVQDPDLAMLALTCRVIEAVNQATSLPRTMGLLALATASGANAPDTGAAQALGAFVLRGGTGLSAIFFAVASTIFAWLLLRGRMIPIPLAWLGVVASVLVVVVLPAQLFGSFSSFSGLVGWLMWMPLLVFEMSLAFLFLFKGLRPSGVGGTPQPAG